MPAAVDILSDILQNSNLDESSIERERSVILREMEEACRPPPSHPPLAPFPHLAVPLTSIILIHPLCLCPPRFRFGQVEKAQEEVLFDHLHATAYQFTSLGRTILGPVANIRSITKANLEEYIRTHYTAGRMVVVGAGAVEHEQLVKLAEAAFGKLPATPTPTAALVAASPAHFTSSEVRMRDDDMTAAHVAVAVQGAAWRDADSVPLMVMQSILGAWTKDAPGGANVASPLAHKLATNELASSYMAFNTNYHDTGLFGVHFVADDRDHVDEAAWAVMTEVARLGYEVSEEEVLRGREALKASLLLHGEGGSSAVAEDIGRQLLTYGRRIPRAELFARIDAVTPDVVKAVAARFINDKDVVVAAAGTTQYLPARDARRARAAVGRGCNTRVGRCRGRAGLGVVQAQDLLEPLLKPGTAGCAAQCSA